MLDHIDTAIQQARANARMASIQKNRPMVGDFVLWTNQTKRRISHSHGDSFQTSYLEAGRFYSTSEGGGSFSGTLQPSVFEEFLIKTDVIEMGLFWFFSHDRSGAGRGVNCELPCRVWRLEPFARSREEAERHPRAISAKRFWADNPMQYESVLSDIMQPRVLTNPDYF